MRTYKKFQILEMLVSRDDFTDIFTLKDLAEITKLDKSLIKEFLKEKYPDQYILVKYTQDRLNIIKTIHEKMSKVKEKMIKEQWDFVKLAEYLQYEKYYLHSLIGSYKPTRDLWKEIKSGQKAYKESLKSRKKIEKYEKAVKDFYEYISTGDSLRDIELYNKLLSECERLGRTIPENEASKIRLKYIDEIYIPLKVKPTKGGASYAN